MNDQKHIGNKPEAPSELELALLELSDVASLTLDNVCGVAYALDLMADENESRGEALALHMLASTLRDGSEKVRAASKAVEALTAGTDKQRALCVAVESLAAGAEVM